MEVIDFLMAQAMAYEAALIAIIRTHPDGKVLSAAIAEAATEISAIAMDGQQVAGFQESFDKKTQFLRRVAESSP